MKMLSIDQVSSPDTVSNRMMEGEMGGRERDWLSAS
jgi:hypothetical protein